MHMADALVSPGVGLTFWTVSVGVTGYVSARLKSSLDNVQVPLMGVLGAFIFAAQMINFTIPGTGSSGHIVGGLLLSIILGNYAAFIVIASILTVQSLFFADGGLLALGCNIFNMGFIPCFFAYPLIYKKIMSGKFSKTRLWVASIMASVIGLQLGALCVVLETMFSGVSELPFKTFLLLMLPIHLAIGAIEGIITAAVISFVKKVKPELLDAQAKEFSIREVVVVLLLVSIFVGGVVSWFASSHPDGLEWAIGRTGVVDELQAPDDYIHSSLNNIQEHTAVFPDYGFGGENGNTEDGQHTVVDKGLTVSGITGGIITMLLIVVAGYFIRGYQRGANWSG